MCLRGIVEAVSRTRPQADTRFRPAYAVAEAAHYIRMPAETLRTWLKGRDYPAGGKLRRFRPLIHLDDPEGRCLSFINLVEAHVLAAIRRHHGVRLPKVRRALEYVGTRFHVQRPLVDQTFQTDGLDLFVERYGEMINASREGQQAMKEILSLYLRRVDRDVEGLPIQLYPFTRSSESTQPPLDAPRVVVINPAVSYGRPVLAGTGIPVAAVYERYKAGDSHEELARDFQLKTSEVEEAIRCEAA